MCVAVCILVIHLLSSCSSSFLIPLLDSPSPLLLLSFFIAESSGRKEATKEKRTEKKMECGKEKEGLSNRKEKKETEREDSHLYAMLMDRWRDETNWAEEGLEEERKQRAVCMVCVCLCVGLRPAEVFAQLRVISHCGHCKTHTHTLTHTHTH